MEADRLRKYPDPTASILVKELASYYGLNEDQVFVGVGSDDVLAMSFLTFFNSDKPVLFPDDVKDYEKENGGVIFPNPNAPTGVYMPLDQVEEILKANQDVVVIVDEAYVDFAGPSALELLDKYENLLVVQTFSKSRSMAGMRIGFAMGHPDLIRALNDVKYSYNSYTMNLPSLLAGVEAVKDKEYFEKTIEKIVATREHAKKRLTELGFTFPNSQSNFIFASHKSVPAEKIFEALKKEQIQVF